MGGRGSKLNVTSFGTKYGTRMTPAQFKSAVSDKANFIFRNLEQDEAIQIVLKRSFKNGVPILEVSSDGINVVVERGLSEETIKSLSDMSTRFSTERDKSKRDMHSEKTWSGYDESRATYNVYAQAVKTLKEAIEELKKRR